MGRGVAAMKRLLILLFSVSFINSAGAATYWGGEVPTVADTKLQTSVTYNGDYFTYTYTIISGPANTGTIKSVDVDVRRSKGTLALDGTGLPKKKHLLDQDFTVPDSRSVPSTLLNPYGRGYCGFDSEGWGGWWGLAVAPGTSPSGFIINSRGLPGIREVKVTPKLQSPTEDQVGDFELAGNDYWKLVASVNFFTKTIGPTALPGNNNGMTSLTAMVAQISAWVDEAATLGWLKDPGLRDALKTRIDFAKNTYTATMTDADTNACRTALTEFMTLIMQSTPAQRTDEAYALFYYNIQYVLDNFPPYYVPIESRLTVSPDKTSATMGTWVNLTALYTENMRPAQNDGYYGPRTIRLRVVSGPNMDALLPNEEGYLCSASDVQYGFWPTPGRLLDATSQVAFTYYSMQEGTDVIVAEQMIEGIAALASPPVEVTWKGGPDMVVGDFFPPLIKLMPGETTLKVNDGTLNQGNGPAGPSITRYYLSTDADINTAVDQYLGERAVPALAPGQQDNGAPVIVNLPGNLQEGDLYYIGACVDAGQTVPELDENNNCSTNGATQISMPMEKIKNQPPDCTAAAAAPGALWPPNHKMAAISITGVTDPDNDPVTLTITAIQQDEPVNGLGDGDTSPDASGIGTAAAQLRAERSGIGNGRVYGVSFNADDGKGGECAGMVAVGVPHDKSGPAAWNDGFNYDSTAP